MIEFVTQVAFETVFHGQPVKARLRRLRRTAWLKLAPLLVHDPATGEVRLRAGEEAFLEAAAEILPAHVEALEGVTVDGQPATAAQLCEEFVFVPLIAEMVQAIFEASTLDAATAGKSAGPAPGPPTA